MIASVVAVVEGNDHDDCSCNCWHRVDAAVDGPFVEISGMIPQKVDSNQHGTHYTYHSII